jgi:prepilin-type N-terminal cleavage/methylation domain
MSLASSFVPATPHPPPQTRHHPMITAPSRRSSSIVSVVPKQGGRDAFTLIELLTVIAVIGILAAILIPTVGKVRAKASETSCRSNLRQLGVAFLMYANDNRGVTPPGNVTASHPRSEGHNFAGIHLLRYYYRNGPRYVWDDAHKFIPEPTEKCTAADRDGTSLSTTDYGMSTYMGNRPLSHYRAPTQTPALWDGWSSTWTNTGKLATRHGGGLNVAFLDAHVERIPAGDKRLHANWWQWATTYETPNPDRLGVGAYLGADTRP